MITSTLRLTLKKMVTDDKDLTENERRYFLSVIEPDHEGATYSDEELVTGAQAAQMLKVTPSTMCNLARAGLVTSIRRTARKVYYVRAEIERKMCGLPAKRPI